MKGLQNIFIALFLVIISLPIVAMLFTSNIDTENAEKRQLSKFPEIEWNPHFSNEVEDFLNDRFGMRPFLVRLGSEVKTNLLNSSSHPDKVQIGKGNWLFYNNLSGDIYNSYSRQNCDDNEVVRLKIKGWKNQKEECDLLGIGYLAVCWPNKHTVYPEYMNKRMQAQIRDCPSLLDRLLLELRAGDTKFTLFDVRNSMFEMKTQQQLYHKFDTHWNDYGAFVAYNSFITSAFSGQVELLTTDEFNIQYQEFCKGDLINLMGVGKSERFCEENPVFSLKNRMYNKEVVPLEGFVHPTIQTMNDSAMQDVKLLIFHDSYAIKLIPYFAQQFREVIFVNALYNSDLVKRFQPNVVISANVERNIGN